MDPPTTLQEGKDEVKMRIRLGGPQVSIRPEENLAERSLDEWVTRLDDCIKHEEASLKLAEHPKRKENHILKEMKLARDGIVSMGAEGVMARAINTYMNKQTSMSTRARLDLVIEPPYTTGVVPDLSPDANMSAAAHTAPEHARPVTDSRTDASPVTNNDARTKLVSINESRNELEVIDLTSGSDVETTEGQKVPSVPLMIESTSLPTPLRITKLPTIGNQQPLPIGLQPTLKAPEGAEQHPLESRQHESRHRQFVAAGAQLTPPATPGPIDLEIPAKVMGGNANARHVATRQTSIREHFPTNKQAEADDVDIEMYDISKGQTVLQRWLLGDKSRQIRSQDTDIKMEDVMTPPPSAPKPLSKPERTDLENGEIPDTSVPALPTRANPPGNGPHDQGLLRTPPPGPRRPSWQRKADRYRPYDDRSRDQRARLSPRYTSY